jgi:polyisoprenoid-binding protein YceI
LRFDGPQQRIGYIGFIQFPDAKPRLLTMRRSRCMSSIATRWVAVSSAAVALTMPAAVVMLASCTPLAVVTHRVDPNPLTAPAGRYALDPHHWSIVFDVDHFHYSRFVMRFNQANAQLDVGAGGIDNAHVTVTVDAESVDTNVALLNKLVAGKDIFDAEHYPKISFDATGLLRTGERGGRVTGQLTIRGTTRPIVLDVTYNGSGVNPLTKAETLGFSATGTVKRSAFGLTTWFPAVGDELRVSIQAEFVKPPSQG